MKKLLSTIVLLLAVANLQAQRISLHTSGAASVGEILAVSGDMGADSYLEQRGKQDKYEGS